jgi:dTDP-glucose 4,6-dehydratase
MEAESFLVTGAAGFIGSHVVEALLAAGRRVTAVVRRTSRSQVLDDYENLRGVVDHPLLSRLAVDLAGPSAVAELAAVDAEVWLHLAADAFVSASLHQPAATVTNNVVSTLNVLEAARRAGPRTLLVGSSSEVYGSQEEPITEAFPLEPATPYAASKVATDRLATSYFTTFGVPVVVARPFNTYGPRHTYDAVPIFIRKAVAGEPLEVTGDGAQSRDLTYVTDTVGALVALADAGVHGEVFNIGTGVDISMLRLAQMVCNLAGSKSEVQMVPTRAGEVRRLCADATKLHRALGWKASVGLEEGLRRNIEWYRSNGAVR